MSLPGLSRSKRGSERVLRMAKGESTQRSDLDAEHLTAHLRQVGIAQLEQGQEEESWLVADGSDLCKTEAEAMPYLRHVKDEQGEVVPGHRGLTVSGMTPVRLCV